MDKKDRNLYKDIISAKHQKIINQKKHKKKFNII